MELAARWRTRPWYLRGAPILVVAFVLEGLLAKGSYPGIRIGFATHIVLTALLLGILFLAGERVRVGQLAGWSALRRRSAALGVSLTLLMGWGLVSAALQTSYFEANLAYWVLWTATYVVAFRSVPRLLSSLTPAQRLDLLSAVQTIGIIGTLLVPVTWQGRLAGVYANPTWSGLFLAAAVIHFGIRAVREQRLRGLWIVLFGIAAALLMLTKTRAAIATAILGTVAGLLSLAADRAAATRLRASRLLLASSYLLLVVGAAAGAGLLDPYTDAMTRQLRLERGTAALYDSRGPVWEHGLSSFGENGLTGRGFLSKYGDEEQSREIFGLRVPSYDWTTTSDPLNSLLLIDQQIGWLGALLFLLLLYRLWRAGVRAPVELRAQFIGFFTLGLITAFANGNWLLSFGDSFDRFSFVSLAALALALAPRVSERTGNSPRRMRAPRVYRPLPTGTRRELTAP